MQPDLYLLTSQIYNSSVLIHRLTSEIHETEGLLEAFDLTFDEYVINNGKALGLTNDSSRRVYKLKLQNENKKYMELKAKLVDLKRQKSVEYTEQQKSRDELELGKLYLRQSIVNQETMNLSAQSV